MAGHVQVGQNNFFGLHAAAIPEKKIGKEIINWLCIFNKYDNEQLLEYFTEVHS